MFVNGRRFYEKSYTQYIATGTLQLSVNKKLCATNQLKTGE